MTAAGCGTSSPRGRLLEQHPIKYAPNGVRTLVRERLHGGYFSISGVRYEFVGQTYFGLREYLEEPSKHGLVRGGGSGTSMKPGDYGVLTMGVERGCIGPNKYLLAFGLLHNPKDTVRAEGHGTPLTFKKVAIPQNLHADGTLIYAVLTRGRTDVVTTAPDGRILRNEPYGEEEPPPGAPHVTCPR